MLNRRRFKHVLNVGALVEDDGAGIRVTCDLHAEMPLEIALVQKLILRLKVLDELLVQSFAVGGAGAIVHVEAEQNDVIASLQLEECLVHTCRLGTVFL